MFGVEASQQQFESVGYGALTAAFVLASSGLAFQNATIGLPLTTTLLFVSWLGIHTARRNYCAGATVKEAILRTSRDYGGPTAVGSIYAAIRLLFLTLFFGGLLSLLLLVVTIATAATGIGLVLRHRLFH